MKKFLIFIFNFFVVNLFGQSNIGIIPTPQSSAIGKYVDIPVSLSTGTPNITIPIYTLKEGNLSLPISLNYHASGIKVGEVASWVGLGWSLDAGGVISRTIVDKRDEVSNLGYWANMNKTNIILDDDTEPDIFSFSFNGYSGKFFIDKDKNVQLVPMQDIKIAFTTGAITGSGADVKITSFTITIPNGNRYIFGEVDSKKAREFMFVGTKCQDTYYRDIVSWHLLRIESFDRANVIDFEYNSNEIYRYYSRQNSSMSAMSNSFSSIWGNSIPIFWTTESSYGFTIGTTPNHLNIKGCRLSKIKSSSVNIDFIASTTDRKDLDAAENSKKDCGALESIKIYSLDNLTTPSYCKKIRMNQDYWEQVFSSSSTPVSINSTLTFPDIKTAYKRLRLLSIEETDCNTPNITQNLKHTFDYEGGNDVSILPNVLSKQIDHWGYFNGSTNNDNIGNLGKLNIPLSLNNLVVFPNSFSKIANANRETNEDKMKLGVLSKISYPTGGSAQFTYEANKGKTIEYTDVLFNKISTKVSNGYKLPDETNNLTNTIAFIHKNLKFTLNQQVERKKN